jgi:hypothetical protein
VPLPRQAPLQHAPAGAVLQLAPVGRQQLSAVPPVGTAQVGVPKGLAQQSEAALQAPVRPLQQVPWAVQLAATPVLQQSLAKRHRPPGLAHWHAPASQLPLQHCPSSEQAVLLTRQQVPPTQLSPPQQKPPEQAEPSGMQQDPLLHTLPPQHGSPLTQELPGVRQHCPLWQTLR